eukprot:TRINITY_DN4080_c0_g1_i1.p1 TRINITY_DN4080_c0_g1~~TRINITY_DN4080_c0_g1_i1.p1  ORF type:complete len:146 (-),score=5.09 TRINITY_DN4080_c0_g1_i1:81-467(-)
MAAARATCLMMPANFFKRSRVCRAAEPVSSVAMANRNYKRNSYRMSRNLQRKKIKGRETKSKDKAWTCISGCGACCKLAKGPLFDSPEDIFDNPKDIAVRLLMQLTLFPIQFGRCKININQCNLKSNC